MMIDSWRPLEHQQYVSLKNARSAYCYKMPVHDPQKTLPSYPRNPFFKKHKPPHSVEEMCRGILMIVINRKKNNNHHHHPNVVFFCQTPPGLSNSCSERNSFCAWSLSRCSSLRALACPQVLSVVSNKLCLHVYLPCCLSIWLTINMSMHTVWHTMCMQQRW